MATPLRLLIRGARQLLTLRGSHGPRRGLDLLDLGLIPDGAVLIENGIIQAVGSSRQVLGLARARNSEEIDATGKVVMPAFVDPSMSVVQTRPSASIIDRINRERSSRGDNSREILRGIVADSAHACHSLSSQILRQRADRLAAAMLSHGTATVGSRAPYASDETMTMKILRVQREQRGPLQILSILRVSSPDRESSASFTDYVCGELLPKVRKRRLACGVDLAIDPDRLLQPGPSKIIHTARQLGFLTGVHTDLFANSSALPLEDHAPLTFLSHAYKVTEAERGMLAASSTVVIFQPGVSFQTGIGLLDSGRAMLDAGVPPGLASGYHPETSPAYSMQMILLLAARLNRFTPEEAISAGTINNAHALKLEDSVGSLETGKQADLLVLTVSDYRELAYYPGINVVDKVVKRGVVVCESGCASVEPKFGNASLSALH